MAFNEKLADRIRELLYETCKNLDEKRMFGSLCFMVNDKMCVGVQRDQLMVRINPDDFEAVLENEHCVAMQMKETVMKGYVLVSEDELKTKKKLSYWLEKALEYNKIAKPSKKKSK